MKRQWQPRRYTAYVVVNHPAVLAIKASHSACREWRCKNRA
jgi:hypothetical protein